MPPSLMTPGASGMPSKSSVTTGIDGTAGMRHWRGGSVVLGWVGAASLCVGIGEFVRLGVFAHAIPASVGLLVQAAGLGVMAVGTSFDLARVVVDHRGGRLAREIEHEVAVRRPA